MTKAQTKRMKKDPNIYPPGWNASKTRSIAKYYDDRKDVALSGNLTSIEKRASSVWIEVPAAIVPQIKKLMARRKKLA